MSVNCLTSLLLGSLLEIFSHYTYTLAHAYSMQILEHVCIQWSNWETLKILGQVQATLTVVEASLRGPIETQWETVSFLSSHPTILSVLYPFHTFIPFPYLYCTFFLLQWLLCFHISKRCQIVAALWNSTFCHMASLQRSFYIRRATWMLFSRSTPIQISPLEANNQTRNRLSFTI